MKAILNKKSTQKIAIALLLISSQSISISASHAATKGWRYWGYFQAAPGSTHWKAAMTGPTVDIADGAVEGWSFVFSSDDVPSVAPVTKPSFASICGNTKADPDTKRIGLVIEFGNPAWAPKGEKVTAIEEARNRALSNQAKTDKFIAKATEMFDKPKWIVMFRPEVTFSGTTSKADIIIGALDGKQLYNHMIDEFTGGSARYNLPKPEYTMPLTLYRGFENIDPAIRDEIMGKLTMFKVFRSANNNNTTYQAEHEIGAGGYVPVNGFNRCVITEEMNFISEGSMRDGVCMLFDK